MAVLLNNPVAPAWEQAQAVYHGAQVATRLKVMGVELTAMGEKEPDRENDEVVTPARPRCNLVPSFMPQAAPERLATSGC
jgi:hypothetical protein